MVARSGVISRRRTKRGETCVVAWRYRARVLLASLSLTFLTPPGVVTLAAAGSAAADSIVPVSGEALVPLPHQPVGVPWPGHTWPESKLQPDVDATALDAATEALFRDRGRGGLPDTRALLVVQRGAIVLERYAPGFDDASRFHSWSVAKSFTNAVVGILVGQKKLDIDAPADVPLWHREPDDPRAAITLRNLLQMSSGLSHGDGRQSASSVVSRMLFGDQVDYMAEFAADCELEHPPGSYWEYATATSNLVADIAQRSIPADRAGMLSFMRRELFEPLGIRSAVPEFDGTGHFIGGVNIHASARDYARLGLLFLRDGVWQAKRILPAGWVDFSRTRAPAKNNGNYAAHFWLSIEPAEGQFPSLLGAPRSTFSANGAQGQFIAIVPTKDLIVIRLGVLHSSTWPQISEALTRVIQPFPELEVARFGAAP